MRLTIRTDGCEGHKKRARARAKRLDRGERIELEISITFESPLDMLEVLTAERMRLCEVARIKPYSVTGLAAALGRDPK